MLAQFLDRLHEARTADELRRVFSGAAAELGVPWFTYHVVRVSGLGSRLPYILSTYPQSWLDHYFGEDYLAVDPVLDEVPRRRRAFRWSAVATRDALTPRQARLFDEARDAGLREGLTIPLLGPTTFATMSLVAGGSERDADDALERHRDLLQLLSLAFHTRAAPVVLDERLRTPRRTSLLSPREREALRWAAVGKSAWETSVILGVSEKAVVFHLDNARRKLNAVNRTQAVVQALVLGLIRLD